MIANLNFYALEIPTIKSQKDMSKKIMLYLLLNNFRIPIIVKF